MDGRCLESSWARWRKKNITSLCRALGQCSKGRSRQTSIQDIKWSLQMAILFMVRLRALLTWATELARSVLNMWIYMAVFLFNFGLGQVWYFALVYKSVCAWLDTLMRWDNRMMNKTERSKYIQQMTRILRPAQIICMKKALFNRCRRRISLSDMWESNFLHHVFVAWCGKGLLWVCSIHWHERRLDHCAWQNICCVQFFSLKLVANFEYYPLMKLFIKSKHGEWHQFYGQSGAEQQGTYDGCDATFFHSYDFVPWFSCKKSVCS